ncbi:hypothetical protein BDK51DRAFT_33769 [Blyttiomyces helicus]|uniref:glutamate--tRNA ligase n=1 Tax=Blyttiomyces helicus TaxID=388810 RepID=A0A4P9W5G2_9FUNG|nr:hypothetical protein BDK51DRAFT_33769 [Blyttiomyces helicus]|eukprot:RKO85336.1 hypothetical protein BDK51DRAFT_33769 [Blyttiomyces helicus]
MNFVYTLLSKRKLAWFVNEGLVTGWDDPRFPTVRGMRRRGLTIDALRQYILMQGASQKDLLLEWDKIWALNKKIIDPIVPRHTALAADKIVKVNIVGETVPPHVKDLPKHKKNPEVGLKKTAFSGELLLEFDDAKELEIGEEVTLMDWGNAIVTAIKWSADKSKIDLVEVKLNLEGDFKKTKKKLTWLSRAAAGPDHAQAPLLLLDYDYLITKKKLEENDDVKDFVTPVTEFKTEAVGDANLKLLKKGDYIQLERKGFFICDGGFDPASPTQPIRLILIPDGKAASTTSKAEIEAPAPASPAKKPTPAAASKVKAATPAPASAQPSTIKMYATKPIYDNPPPTTDHTLVSKMYAVKPVYGDAEIITPTWQMTPVPAAVPAAVPAVDGKKAKAPKAEKAPAPVANEASLISKLDMVVGKILSVKRHPDADSLYVEQIDVGEEKPREVVSGLVKFMKEEELEGRTILVLKNLKPASMRGVKSFAMVMCASDAEHTKVEFLIPPEGSLPGDKVYFEGHEGEPEAQLNPKKKVFETLQPDFTTTSDLVAVWNGVPFRTARGVVKTGSLVGASIK